MEHLKSNLQPKTFCIRMESCIFAKDKRLTRQYIHQEYGNLQRCHLVRPPRTGRFLRHLVRTLQGDAPRAGKPEAAAGRPPAHHQSGCGQAPADSRTIRRAGRSHPHALPQRPAALATKWRPSVATTHGCGQQLSITADVIFINH